MNNHHTFILFIILSIVNCKIDFSNQNVVTSADVVRPQEFCSNGRYWGTVPGNNIYIPPYMSTSGTYETAQVFVSIENSQGTKQFCTMSGQLTIIPISNLPSNVSINTPATAFCLGGNMTLSCNTQTASGRSFVWIRNGAVVSTTTTNTYNTTLAGTYKVRISQNSCFVNGLDSVTLNVYPPASNISASGNTSICAGGSLQLNANTGAGIIYQWQLNGINISGANSSAYNANSAGNYTCIVAQNNCSAVSNAIAVTVNALPTATISALGNTSICSGQNVSLTASTASGNAYQWQLNGTNISGANTSTYNANTAGNYTFAPITNN